MFGQSFELHDLFVVGVLIVLEGVLSIDNALVLGLLARRVPRSLRARALSYGLIGAFVFRIIAILVAGFLLQWRLPKLLGGAYLVYVAIKHFIWPDKSSDDALLDSQGKPLSIDELTGRGRNEEEFSEEMVAQTHGAGIDPEQFFSTHSKLFWQTVLVIELTDIAFAVDSIVAAMGVISSTPKPEGVAFHPKLWLVMVGGMLGVIVMRFAAAMFIKLLEKFPRFETSAYLLVLLIGGKLCIDYFVNTDHNNPALNFHSASSPATWIFWLAMIACFSVGFIRKPARLTSESTSQSTS